MRQQATVLLLKDFFTSNPSVSFVIGILILLLLIWLCTGKKEKRPPAASPATRRPRPASTLNDCISEEDLSFQIDDRQKALEQELSKSREKIAEAKRKGYIKASVTWTERFDRFTEVSNTLYKNLEYENSKKLVQSKFHRYTSLHFRSMLLGDLAHQDYMESKKIRDEIGGLLVEIGKKKVTVSRADKAELYQIKDTCVKTTKYLYDRMVKVQLQTRKLKEKIRDECGARGREWYDKLESNKQRNRK